MTRVSTPDCVADSAHLSPMWLRHHHVDQLDRCCRIANHQVCRRCVVLYPLTVICALLYLAGWWLPPASDPWLLWLLPAPMVAEWAAGMWGAAYRPRRQILATALGAVASGVALAVHSQTPFAARVAWPVTVYVCLGFAIAAVAGWKAHRVSARSRLTADADEAFERSEAARTQRLVHMLESVRPD